MLSRRSGWQALLLEYSYDPIAASLCWVAGGLLGVNTGRKSRAVSAYLQMRLDGCALDRDFVVAAAHSNITAKRSRSAFPTDQPKLDAKRWRIPSSTPPDASTTFCASPNRQSQNAKKARVWDRAF